MVMKPKPSPRQYIYYHSGGEAIITAKQVYELFPKMYQQLMQLPPLHMVDVPMGKIFRIN